VSLYLGLDLLEQSLELVHVGLLLGPADTETLLRVGLGDLSGVRIVSDHKFKWIF